MGSGQVRSPSVTAQSLRAAVTLVARSLELAAVTHAEKAALLLIMFLCSTLIGLKQAEGDAREEIKHFQIDRNAVSESFHP